MSDYMQKLRRHPSPPQQERAATVRRFVLDGPGLHLARTFENWPAFDLSRLDQWNRTTLAAYLNLEAERTANCALGPDRGAAWERVRALRLLASTFQNCGASAGGSAGDLRWSLTLEPEPDEAA